MLNQKLYDINYIKNCSKIKHGNNSAWKGWFNKWRENDQQPIILGSKDVTSVFQRIKKIEKRSVVLRLFSRWTILQGHSNIVSNDLKSIMVTTEYGIEKIIAGSQFS